ncbi:hypothetical protein EST38_g13255 [Candolleomyces aberdarensis]|uniref:Uncharacterized protein n=1 Tax=Candolleomyces aberdarensis TaxID=2316362 RepID=A0A4Q2D141_9AGAR|nr:hypothetical protein EST38_g13255 [Candolleomyces aberdarensis]
MQQIPTWLGSPENFPKLCEIRLPKPYSQQSLGERPIDLIVDFLTRLWECTRDQITRAIGALNTTEVWLTVPVAWVAKGCEIFTRFDVKDPRNSTVGLINQALQLLEEQLAGVEQPTHGLLPVGGLDGSKYLKQREVDQPIHALLLVGGFDSSEYLEQSDEQQVGKLIAFIARPPSADTATLDSSFIATFYTCNYDKIMRSTDEGEILELC